MSRRQARESILKILFEIDLGGKELNAAVNDYKMKSKDKYSEFVIRIVEGTVLNMDQIDNLIESAIVNWKLDRLATVDRNILRSSVYEINISNESPKSIVINEAVELAKKYGTHESSKFVNGVLAKITKNKE